MLFLSWNLKGKRKKKSTFPEHLVCKITLVPVKSWIFSHVENYIFLSDSVEHKIALCYIIFVTSCSELSVASEASIDIHTGSEIKKVFGFKLAVGPPFSKLERTPNMSLWASLGTETAAGRFKVFIKSLTKLLGLGTDS